MSISNGFYINKFDFSLKVASRYTSSVFIIAAVFCSMFGFLTDKIGYRVTFVIIASTILFFSYLLLIVMPSSNDSERYINEAIIPLILIGIAYSIYASALWPMIPIVIPEEYLGTAFGTTLAIQNCGLAIVPYFVGLLKEIDSSYYTVLVFFLLVSSFGIICEILLYFVSKNKHNNALQLPSSSIIQAIEGE
mmetsp:Transcript_20872/g.23209  ORF Transcript_20872/g.23209 Transcript_20872/m.23209 type:complete len:192 (+) Transcript_20872:902-1477(+)